MNIPEKIAALQKMAVPVHRTARPQRAANVGLLKRKQRAGYEEGWLRGA
jgi:hypothetical protein